jgi:hypothetical protein
VLVRTDDEVYRVDAVWLGPPRATFPWRARYVSYGLGLAVMIVIMFVQRRIGISLDFFSVAWALILTVLLTRFLGKRIDYERPLGQIVALFRHEVVGPRERRVVRGGTIRPGRFAVRPAAARRGPAARSTGRPQAGRPQSGSPQAGRPRPAGSPAPWPTSAGRAADSTTTKPGKRLVRGTARRSGRA